MESVIISELRKNSLEHVRISLNEYNGVHLIDARIFYKKHETGEMLPSSSGVTLKIDRIGELIESLQKAKAEAEARGLIGAAS